MNQSTGLRLIGPAVAMKVVLLSCLLIPILFFWPRVTIPVLHDVASADTFLPEYPVSGEREPDTINFPVALVRFLPDGVTQGFVIVGVLLGYGVF